MAIDIGLEFILVLIVVLTPHPALSPVENLLPQVNLIPALTLCLILKTAAAKESRLILELVVHTGITTSRKSGIRNSCTAKIGYSRRQAIEAV